MVERILEQGLRPEEAAQSASVSVRTAYKWLRRFREEGERGLVDRSSRPHHCPHALPEATRAHIVAARTERQTYRQISQSLNVSHSSVGRVLVRQGLNRLASLEPAPPVERYEYDAPGGMLHLDIKKLGRFERPGHRVTADRSVHTRGAGWEYVHIAIDDHTRLATASVLPDETARSACRALLDAIRHYRRLGIRFVRVLTDNGVAYRSRLFGRLCRRLGIRHTFTKPYTPRTNGKAERVIQTALREWAYARRYESSAQRSEHLPGWLHRYNWHRPHASLGYLPPVSRLSSLNNLVGLHS